ncbi:MAG: HU family DNA-binding protein [Acidimicrobiales bacterium]
MVNKADVIDRVAEAAGVAKQQAEGVLDAFFDTVKSAVKSGDKVGWPNFGAFSGSDRKARTGRNPRTGEAVKIPASKAIKFSPGSSLKEYLNAKPPAKKAAKAAGASTKKAAATKAAPAKKAPAKKAPAKKAAAKKAAKR